MTRVFAEDPQLNFLSDFSEDVAEKRASDELAGERKDEAA